MNTSRAPMNHAERPLFVTKVAVTVAIITIVTALGNQVRRPPKGLAAQSSPLTAAPNASSPGAIVFLNVVSESAQQKRRSQHGKRIGNDSAGDRCLHQHVLPGVERSHCY